MAHLNSNNNNSELRQTGCSVKSPKPALPSKPAFLINYKSNGTEKHNTSECLKETNETRKKGLTRMGSLDHVTPKVWSSRPAKVLDDNSLPAENVLCNTELPKSCFHEQWRPAPRPRSVRDLEENLHATKTKPCELSAGLEKNVEKNELLYSNQSKKMLNLKLPETVPENEEVHSIEKESSRATQMSGNKQRSTTQLQYRKSFSRDPKSPGFGTLKRLWNAKSDGTESFSPKPFINVSVSQKEKPISKPRSYTIPAPGSAASWQHVDSPCKTESSNSHSDTQMDASGSVDIVTPKPFRSSSTSDDTCGLTGEEVHYNAFSFDQDAVDFTYSTDNLHGVQFNNTTLLEKWNANRHLEQDNSSQSSHSPGSDSFVAEVGVSQGINQKDNLAHDCPSLEVAIYNDEDERRMISELYDIAAQESSSEDGYTDEAPPVPPHQHLPSPPQTFVPKHRIPSLGGYLPMASHGLSTEEIRYVDMSQDQIDTVDYSQRVIPPPPGNQTKSKWEYHEIDPEVPPPPRRNPPKLPSELSRSSGPPSPIPFEEEEESHCPPPLPPDNTVGRRSMMYTEDKKLKVVQKLQENVAKSSQGKSGKKLNYVEVEFTTNSKSKKRSPSSTRKTDYSDVVVLSEGEFQLRERSGSGTSEEGLPSNKKKQKNVKKKILHSLFSKDEAKSNQTKEVQETLTDFEKERNKKKRISGRFLRKKSKDTTKTEKIERNSDAASSDVGIYVDTDSGFVTSSETSISSTAPVVASSGSSSHGSADGEVVRQPHPAPSQVYSDGNEKIRWKVLPDNISERRKSDQITTSCVPPAPYAGNRSHRKSHDRLESTFLAYPVDQSASTRSQCDDNLNVDAKPKVSSFLYGSNESQRHSDHRRSRPTSVPPQPPHHNRLSHAINVSSENKRLSVPISTTNKDTTPPRPLPKPSPKYQDPAEHSPDPKHGAVPLPGMVAVLPQPFKGGSPVPLPPRLPKISPLTIDISTSSSLSTDPNEEYYEEATDGALETDFGLYVPADDVPPPLPEKDETLYESIPASHQVPPSSFPEDVDDTSKLLQSEPLYQIYRNRTMSHASAKRFTPNVSRREEKSTSQKGGKWESELMSDDLGTSTLWRSIPEVVMSEIAEKLSRDEIKLQQAQFEVVTSQASYMRSLNILVNHFMKDRAMQSADYLPTADRHRLFSNIEAVSAVEGKFLQDVEKHFWKDIQLTRVCDLIAQYAKKDFKVYILYIQNQVYQDRTLTKLQRNNDKFSEELCRLESSPACNKLPLLSFLMLPMQRVTRLPLLVSAIVNAADAAGDMQMCTKAKHTLGVVNKLVKKCNEGARKMQQTEQLAEIASQLDYSPSVKMYALVSQSRSLVKKGEINVSMSGETKKASKTSKMWLFLFSDVLFIAKKKSYMEFGSSPRFEVVDWANRQYLAVNEQAVTENAIFLVILENQAGKRIEMSLMPLAHNELRRWEKALNPPSLGMTGESIYESWDCPQYSCVAPYESQQPDELSLDVGDVMQVLKKTSDGWLEGERLRDGESGWFPAVNCEEIEDEHVRSRNMKNLFRTTFRP